MATKPGEPIPERRDTADAPAPQKLVPDSTTPDDMLLVLAELHDCNAGPFTIRELARITGAPSWLVSTYRREIADRYDGVLRVTPPAESRERALDHAAPLHRRRVFGLTTRELALLARMSHASVIEFKEVIQQHYSGVLRALPDDPADDSRSGSEPTVPRSLADRRSATTKRVLHKASALDVRHIHGITTRELSLLAEVSEPVIRHHVETITQRYPDLLRAQPLDPIGERLLTWAAKVHRNESGPLKLPWIARLAACSDADVTRFVVEITERFPGALVSPSE